MHIYNLLLDTMDKLSPSSLVSYKLLALWILSCHKQNEALWKAFDDKSETDMKRLLDQGADPNFYGPGTKAYVR